MRLILFIISYIYDIWGAINVELDKATLDQAQEMTMLTKREKTDKK